MRVLPVRSGTSQRGEWKTLPFVFEYFENAEQRWSDKVLLETFDTNIMAQIGAYCVKDAQGKAVIENGEMKLRSEIRCRVGFSHGVRTYNRQDGTQSTMNDVRLYKFELLTGVAPQPVPQQAAAPQTMSPQPFAPQPMAPQHMAQPVQAQIFPPAVDANGAPIDDLPF